MELNFVATDDFNVDDLLDDELLFKNYLVTDANNFLGLESAYIDSFANLQKMLNFLFCSEVNMVRVASKDEKQIFELSFYKNKCLTFDQLDDKYLEWLEISRRQNTMDEYGNLLGIIGYINRNREKQNLFLITVNDK